MNWIDPISLSSMKWIECKSDSPPLLEIKVECVLLNLNARSRVNDGQLA